MEIAGVRNALGSYIHAAESCWTEIVQPTLDHLIINRAGNNQRDMKIVALEELLPDDRSVDQP